METQDTLFGKIHTVRGNPEPQWPVEVGPGTHYVLLYPNGRELAPLALTAEQALVQGNALISAAVRAAEQRQQA